MEYREQYRLFKRNYGDRLYPKQVFDGLWKRGIRDFDGCDKIIETADISWDNIDDIIEELAIKFPKSEISYEEQLNRQEEFEKHFREWSVKEDKKALNEFYHLLYELPSVVLIIGARGEGKTAFGLRILEDIKAQFPERPVCALGFNKPLPDWIEKYDNINNTPVEAVVFIDEAGMYGHKKLFLQSLILARHNDQTLIYAVQNSANATIDILRQVDILAFKKPSMMQAQFERKQMKSFFEEVLEKFDKIENTKKCVWIVSEKYRGMIEFELPSFWSDSISKAFRK